MFSVRIPPHNDEDHRHTVISHHDAHVTSNIFAEPYRRKYRLRVCDDGSSQQLDDFPDVGDLL